MTYLVFLVSFSLVASTDKVVLAIFLLSFLIHGQTNKSTYSRGAFREINKPHSMLQQQTDFSNCIILLAVSMSQMTFPYSPFLLLPDFNTPIHSINLQGRFIFRLQSPSLVAKLVCL
jgi:hypothetical protein